MNCKHVQNRLSAYLDGELAGREMLELRHHVQECACCGEEVEALRTLKSMLGTPETFAPPADLEERLVAAVLRAEKPKMTAGWRAHLGIASAAVAAALLAFVLASKASGPIKAQPLTEIAYSSEITQDQAYFIGSDPLGPPSAVPVSYAGQ